MQRAAECDVDDLRAATDPEQRDTALYRAAHQRGLPGVSVPARLYGLVGGGVALLAVGRRIQIASAGEDQAVKAVQHSLGGLCGLRRQQHGGAAREVDAFHVDGGQKCGVHIPDPALRLLQIRGQADDWRRIRAAQNRVPFPSR